MKQTWSEANKKSIKNMTNTDQIISIINFNKNSLNKANKDRDEIVTVNLSRDIWDNLPSMTHPSNSHLSARSKS